MTASLETVTSVLSRVYGRTPFGHFPTPVTAVSLPGVTSPPHIWVKRDDLSSRIYGGNKTRKLEFLLKYSHCPILTFGPLGSHHVYATARHAKALGRRTAAVLVPQPMTPHHQLIHEQIRILCDPVIELSASPLSWTALSEVIIPMVSPRRPMYQIIPPGGTTPLGTLGYVIGALELAAQVNAGLLPEPQKIFVPLGTGGTSVGIAIGLAMANLRTETVAVRVVPKMTLPKASLSLLMARTLRLICKAGLPAPSQNDIRFTVQDGFSNGYGLTNAAADEAMALGRQAEISLETTYSAKTMAALISQARISPADNCYLFWQTFADAHDAAV